MHIRSPENLKSSSARNLHCLDLPCKQITVDADLPMLVLYIVEMVEVRVVES